MHISIQDLFKKLFSKHKKSVTKPFSPESDWRTILVSFALINLLIIAWSAYLFFFAQNPDAASTSPSFVLGTTSQNKSQVDRIFSSFQAKASSTEVILQTKPEISDPS